MARQFIIHLKPGKPLRFKGMLLRRKGIRVIEGPSHQIDVIGKACIGVPERIATGGAEGAFYGTVTEECGRALDAEHLFADTDKSGHWRTGCFAAIRAMAIGGKERRARKRNPHRAAAAAAGCHASVVRHGFAVTGSSRPQGSECREAESRNA